MNRVRSLGAWRNPMSLFKVLRNRNLLQINLRKSAHSVQIMAMIRPLCAEKAAKTHDLPTMPKGGRITALIRPLRDAMGAGAGEFPVL